MSTPTLALPEASPLPRRELSVVIAMQLSYGFCWSMFLLLPKFLTTELHASPSEIGLVAAVPSLSAALAVPFVGRLVDRVGRRPLILAGSALAALQAFAFMGVDRIGPLLLLLQLCYGVSFVIVFNAAGTQAADLAPPERLTQVLGVFGASNVAMNAIAPAVGEPLASAVGWQPVFASAGAAAVLACLFALRIRDVERPLDSAPPAHASLSGGLLLCALSMCAVGVAFAVAVAFYQPFALSLGIHQVRGFFLGFASSVVVARVALGWLPDRVGRKRTAVASLVLYAAVELGMSRLAPGTLVLYGALLGCAHGFFYPALNALALEGTDLRKRGLVMTYVNGAFQLGYTLSVLAFGWIAERAGFPTIFVLGAVVAAVAALVLGRAPLLVR